MSWPSLGFGIQRADWKQGDTDWQREPKKVLGAAGVNISLEHDPSHSSRPDKGLQVGQ